MRLLQVDIVRLQALEARVDRLDDVTARQSKAVGTATRRCPAFRREDDPVAVTARLHPPPDDAFGFTDRLQRAAERVRVRRVEELDPRIERSVENALALVLFRLKTERHRAQA